MKRQGEPIARIARATGLSRVTVYRVLDRLGHEVKDDRQAGRGPQTSPKPGK
jgi:hypothetical protein